VYICVCRAHLCGRPCVKYVLRSHMHEYVCEYVMGSNMHEYTDDSSQPAN
jgi:hypothetical protein